ncbi:hemerythrin domain-containing protein, partial [Brevibacterium sp. UMB10442]|nr:hemerythrin domain-containing protein [Brevibacterium sp. UMB10442]
IAAFRTHLSRKQNQLYSILEQKGFDRPTTTMWLLDDFVRDEIRDAKNLIEEDKEEEFLAMQSTIVADVRDLLQKEESVLYPTA